MSDSEDDYMSEDVLKSCTQKDVRPGLLHSSAQRRQHEMYKKQVDHARANISIAEKEKQLREEGLSKPLSETNKGFLMLQKLGYKPGEGIGKDGEKGRKEPIALQLKRGCKGLGLGDYNQTTSQGVPEVSTEEFRKALSAREKAKSVKNDLCKAQFICQQLDEQFKREAATPWHWLPPTTSTKEGEDEDEEEKEKEKEEELTEDEISCRLVILTKYLRDTYSFCQWCGCFFNDDKDLDENCPGPTRDFH